MLTVAGLTLGEGSRCDPTSRPCPSAGGGGVATDSGKFCEGSGGLPVPSLPGMEQHKLSANSSMKLVL